MRCQPADVQEQENLQEAIELHEAGGEFVHEVTRAPLQLREIDGHGSDQIS